MSTEGQITPQIRTARSARTLDFCHKFNDRQPFGASLPVTAYAPVQSACFA